AEAGGRAAGAALAGLRPVEGAHREGDRGGERRRAAAQRGREGVRGEGRGDAVGHDAAPGDDDVQRGGDGGGAERALHPARGDGGGGGAHLRVQAHALGRGAAGD